jgi:hypothetical protein
MKKDALWQDSHGLASKVSKIACLALMLPYRRPNNVLSLQSRIGAAAIKANPSRGGSAKPRASHQEEVAGLPNSGGVSR